MKKLIFILLFFTFTLKVFAAELLVKAKPHYMDSYTQEQIDKMTVSEKQSYEARSQIGDIIAIYPNGICKENPSPNSDYVIIKVPNLTMEEAEKYKETITAKKEVAREITVLKSEYDTLVKDGTLTEKGSSMMSFAKVPTITSTKSVETAKGTEQEYTINATINEIYLKKLRKYQVPKDFIEKIDNSKTIVIGEKETEKFINNIIDKSKAI